MKQYIFSVYDSKAEMFNQPMFFKAKPEALRAFTDECNRAESALNHHPEDYSLFLLGEYDLESGLITPLTSPTSMGMAVEFATQKALNLE